ncbi:MAG: PAS domain-containing sensor histidine kinase [Flavobacteriales bacterium]
MVGRACAVSAFAGGGLALTGWLGDLPALTDWFGSGIHTQPNTAVAITALGLALWLRMNGNRMLPIALGVLAGTVGFATWCEYLFHVDLGIDQLLIRADRWQTGTTAPGRMGFPASTMFILHGTAVVLAGRGVRAQQAAAIAAMGSIAIASLSIIGKLYGAHDLYIIPAITAISVNTAILFAVLSVGLVSTLPDVEPARSLVADNSAGMLVRRAFAVIILVPILIGWLRLQGEAMGLYDVPFGSTMRTIVEVFLLLGLLWWMAAVVARYERRHAESEAALRVSDQRYHSFIQLSSEGIWRCELTQPMPLHLPVEEAVDWAYQHGVMAECNDAMARMYGYEHGTQLVGARLFDLLPRNADNEAYLGAFMSSDYCLLGGESEERDKEGRTLYFSNNLVGFVKDGFLVHAWGTQQDITQRRLAAAKLVESETRLRLMADNLDQLIWISGGGTWLNRRWEEYTGLTSEAIIASEGRNTYHPDEADANIARVRAHFAKSEAWEDVLRLRAGDGSYGTFLVRALPDVDEHGKVQRWFGSHTNITELIQAKQQLELSDRRKDEFLATLSHELRNPLMPLLNGLELLVPATGYANEEEERVHRMMRKQLDHLVHLIDDLMDVSRISRGKIQLRTAPMDLLTVLQEAVSTTQTIFRTQDHTLRLDLPAAPMHLTGDALRLTQIFVNLLNNAAKYTPIGGNVQLSARAEGPHWVVCVQDNGIGLAPEHHTIIFETFSQVGSVMAHYRDGLGIGLSLVKRLVEMHGGTVEVSSDGLGAGSTFSVRLPMGAQVLSGGAPKGGEAELAVQ